MIDLLRRPLIMIPLLVAVALAGFMLVTGTSQPLLVGLAVIAALIALIEPALVLRDRLLRDPELTPVRPYKVGTVERYFQVWLTEFGREQGLFATMEGDTVVANRYQDQRRVTYDSIIDVVESFSRFVIIGEPGEGKSSAMKGLMAQSIHNYRHSRGQTPLPLWINLGFSGNPVEAEDLIGYWWYEQHRLPGTPDVYLARNGLILYLDGLNEMPEYDGSRTTRAASLRAFIEKYPKMPVIVTCRIRDYQDDQDLNLGLPVLTVIPMDSRRVQNFIRSQLDSVEMWHAIEGKPALERLSASGYRLRMLTDLYQKFGADLPQDVTSLFEAYLKMHYDEFSRTGKARVQSWSELDGKMRQLAYGMMARGNGTAIPSTYAQRQIGRAALKDAIEMRFIRREDAVVRFYNHAMHGYFAAPLLLQTLREGDSPLNIPPRAIETMRHIGDAGEAAAPTVPELTNLLYDPDPVVRQMAAFALGRIGEPAAPAVPALIEALADPAQHVRDFAAFALGRIGEAAAPALPKLIPALSDTQPVVRLGAALALRQIGPAAEPAIPALVTALNDASHQVGQFAALALGQIGAKAAAAVPALIALLDTPDEDLRYSAAFALARIGEPAMPDLTRMLKSDDSGQRISAALAFGEMGRAAAAAVPMLAAMLQERSAELRHAASLALEKINTPGAREALSQYTGSL